MVCMSVLYEHCYLKQQTCIFDGNQTVVIDLQIFSLFRLIKYVRQMAFSAILAIMHGSHKDTSTTLRSSYQSWLICYTTRKENLPPAQDTPSSTAQSCHLHRLCSTSKPPTLSSYVYALFSQGSCTPSSCASYHHHADARQDGEWILFGYCNLKVCGRLPVVSRQKSIVAGLVGCLPYLQWTEDQLSVIMQEGERLIQTLNFGLDIINGIGRLHLEGNSLTSERFDENLHLDLV